jgi:hypothetical protein
MPQNALPATIKAGKHTFLFRLALEIVAVFYNMLLIEIEVHLTSSCPMVLI